jgi:amino-acid N-acetyltransferase
MRPSIRTGTGKDARGLFSLIAANLTTGHLLPRTLEDLQVHADRFVVVGGPRRIVGCAELAPLSDEVAEVRSLVVDERYRGRGFSSRLVDELKDRARRRGYQTLCAFTHEPSHFIRQGFSIVPHVWLPEKIAHDCRSCALFRRCGQYAMVFSLEPPAFDRAPAIVPARLSLVPAGARA